MKISYYPGCSLDGTAREYGESTDAICRRLDIELVELSDWSCCGANAAASVDEDLGVQLGLRNLAIADKQGMDLLIPCVGCFNRLRAAKTAFTEDPSRAGSIAYEGKVAPVFLMDFLSREDVSAKIKEQVRRPLKGLKLACYYGCVIVRPPSVTGVQDFENPQAMERLMALLGAETVDWPYKTDCCGADLGITRSDVTKTLVGRILDMAGEAGAEALVVACPLCFTNLDNRQGEILSENLGEVKMPIFYLTELIGLALEVPSAKDWWRRHITDPRPFLSSKGLI